MSKATTSKGPDLSDLGALRDAHSPVCISRKPVWRLKTGTSSVVIKVELLDAAHDLGAVSFDFGFDLMQRAGGKGAAGRQMSAAEIDAFCDKLDGEQKDDAETRRDAGCVFVAMHDVGRTIDLTATKGKADDQKREAALLMLIGLKQPKYLNRLGRIIAVDMFLGNTDRFKFNSRGNESSIATEQNVIFKIKDDEGQPYYSITGLDATDPSSSWAKLDQDLLTCGQQVTDIVAESPTWPGLKLKDDDFLKEYAYRVLKDLVTFLKAKLGAEKDNYMFVLGAKGKSGHGGNKKTSHTKMIVAGMREARSVIKETCKARLAGHSGRAGIPAGLRSRMKALGWV